MFKSLLCTYVGKYFTNSIRRIIRFVLSSFFLLELRSALGAVPLALGLGRQPDAAEVVPLDGAVGVVAANHLAVRNLEEK